MKITKTNISVISATAFLIILTGIYFGQELIRMLPLIFSLAILMYQSKANRYAYLAGSLNSLLYGVVYLLLGLYATACTAVFVSFPLQLLTFFNWKKHAYGKNTAVFKKMTPKIWLLTALAFSAVWVIELFALRALGSDYAIWDNSVSLLGILVTVLTAVPFVEYTYFSVFYISVLLLLNLKLTVQNTVNITFFINSMFQLYCSVNALINVKRIYKIQQEEK